MQNGKHTPAAKIKHLINKLNETNLCFKNGNKTNEKLSNTTMHESDIKSMIVMQLTQGAVTWAEQWANETHPAGV